MSYSLNLAASFCKISGTVLTMQPPATEGGSYPVTITLTDKNPIPKSQNYDFNVIVIPTAAPKTASTNSSSSNSSTSNPFPGVIIPTNDPNASP